MLMLGVNETMHLLATAKSMRWFGHVWSGGDGHVF